MMSRTSCTMARPSTRRCSTSKTCCRTSVQREATRCSQTADATEQQQPLGMTRGGQTRPRRSAVPLYRRRTHAPRAAQVSRRSSDTTHAMRPTTAASTTSRCRSCAQQPQRRRQPCATAVQVTLHITPSAVEASIHEGHALAPDAAATDRRGRCLCLGYAFKQNRVIVVNRKALGCRSLVMEHLCR